MSVCYLKTRYLFNSSLAVSILKAVVASATSLTHLSTQVTVMQFFFLKDGAQAAVDNQMQATLCIVVLVGVYGPIIYLCSALEQPW